MNADAIWDLVAEVRQRLLTGLNPDAFNIGINDGLAAGQTIEHAHVHSRTSFNRKARIYPNSLFGSERSALNAARPILTDLQDGLCFYCSSQIRSGEGEIDHFVPWAKYPIDLTHNLVLANRKCNSNKRDHLPHIQHLARWSERNARCADEITAADGCEFLAIFLLLYASRTGLIAKQKRQAAGRDYGQMRWFRSAQLGGGSGANSAEGQRSGVKN